MKIQQKKMNSNKQKIIFVGHKKSLVFDLIKKMLENKEIVFKDNALDSEKALVIFNFDDEKNKAIKERSKNAISYGFESGADVLATDVNLGEKEANFKINFQGSSIPFWIKNIFDKENLYNALEAVTFGIAGGMNMVEISQIIGNN